MRNELPFFSESPVWSQLNQRVLKPLSGIHYHLYMHCTVRDCELMRTTNVLHSMRQELNRVQWCIKEQWLCIVENSQMLSG